MSKVDTEAMRRYERTRDDLVARLLDLEGLLEDEARASVAHARLRLERARTVQWALLTGQLVWWIPLAIVAFKGLLGVDLYTVSAFMPTFMAINLAVGVVFIPVALLSARVIGPLLADTRFSRSLIDAITGRDLAEAQAMAKRIGSFQ